MPSKQNLLVVAAFVASAAAQTTTTATLLLPDWCVTQSEPTVTVLGSNSLTTYSYSCSINSAAVSSAEAKASRIAESAQRKASELRASLGVPEPTEDADKLKARNMLGAMEQRDSSYECYGFDAFDACIPWEITQGASYWAVHYTASNIVAVDQECTFGEGGVVSGSATCTASGRLDPEIWGTGGGSHTETFAKTEVDTFFIRNTVVATAGGDGGNGGGAGTGTGDATAPGETGSAAGANSESTGLAVPRSLPTGAVAVMAGAGGILAAALAL